MSKFFRKVASAFVVMDENAQRGRESDAEGANAGLEDITKETSSLLAQLEGGQSREEGQPAAAATLLDLTAEDVFRQQQVEDSPSNALRLLKLVAGLSMFPREQQLAMVRAMDVADDTWSEAAVAQDAQRRQAILREHLSRVAAERARRTDEIAHTIDDTKKTGEAVLAELDKRIAELYARREQEAAATASAVSELEQQQRELEARETRARQGTSQVIQALAGLLSFLGVAQRNEQR